MFHRPFHQVVFRGIGGLNALINGTAAIRHQLDKIPTLILEQSGFHFRKPSSSFLDLVESEIFIENDLLFLLFMRDVHLGKKLRLLHKQQPVDIFGTLENNLRPINQLEVGVNFIETVIPFLPSTCTGCVHFCDFLLPILSNRINGNWSPSC